MLFKLVIIVISLLNTSYAADCGQGTCSTSTTNAFTPPNFRQNSITNSLTTVSNQKEVITSSVIILQGQQKIIKRADECKTIVNNSTRDYIIPSGTAKGWSSFLTYLPSGFTVSDCAEKEQSKIPDKEIKETPCNARPAVKNAIEACNHLEVKLEKLIIDCYKKIKFSPTSNLCRGETTFKDFFSRKNCLNTIVSWCGNPFNRSYYCNSKDTTQHGCLGSLGICMCY